MREALAKLDHLAAAEILDEIEPLPLVVGRRYRIRTLAGKPDAQRVVHACDEAGQLLHVEYPVATHPEWLEMVLTFDRRVYGLPGRRSPGSGLYLTEDGRTALLADIDILELEEVTS